VAGYVELAVGIGLLECGTAKARSSIKAVVFQRRVGLVAVEYVALCD